MERTFMLNVINTIGRTLKFVGLNPLKLDPVKIISKAKKKSDFKGDLPIQVEMGISKIVNSVNKEAKLSLFGTLAAKLLFERTLTGRLKIEKILRKNPNIEQAEINQPVFIIGMPRTGTTILHALMHEDEAHRSPLLWECLIPTPVPTPNNYTDNKQIRKVVRELDQIFKLVPDFKKKHHVTASSPQECVGINAFDFNSFQFAAQFYVPSYMNWFSEEANRLSTMHFHKRFLQYLQSGGVRSERWLLKSPVHLIRLSEIFEVYPDARIIMTHRHPSKLVSSVTSLISSLRSIYSDHENPVLTGFEQAHTWSAYFDTFIKSRKKLNKESQIIDLYFDDFVNDQISVVRKIYNKFDWKLSNVTLGKMEEFLTNNPKDMHGNHDHNLEEFGLDEKQIDRLFSKYNDFLEQL